MSSEPRVSDEQLERRLRGGPGVFQTNEHDALYDLRDARARIAELEAENELLRSESADFETRLAAWRSEWQVARAALAAPALREGEG